MERLGKTVINVTEESKFQDLIFGPSLRRARGSTPGPTPSLFWYGTIL